MHQAKGTLRTIGQVSQELDIKPHILRYWEEQFPMLRPLKRAGRRRYYRPEDMELLAEIHRLVNEEGFTIAGARKALTRRRQGGPGTLPALQAEADASALPDHVEQGLLAVRARLERAAALIGE